MVVLYGLNIPTNQMHSTYPEGEFAMTDQIEEAGTIFSQVGENAEPDQEDLPLAFEFSEEQLQAAYRIFSGYTGSRFGVYFDTTILPDLQAAQIPVSSREQLDYLCACWRNYFDIRQDKRLYYFTLKTEEAIAPKPKRRLFMRKAIITAVIFAVLAVAVVAIAGGMFINREQDESLKESLAVNNLAPAVLPVAAVQASVDTLRTEVDTSSVKLKILDMIDAGRITLAMKTLQENSNQVDSAFFVQTEERIREIAVEKADSVITGIKIFTAKSKYLEAFELEQKFAKIIFPLAGIDSKELRHAILRDWANSFLEIALSQEPAGQTVTADRMAVLKKAALDKVSAGVKKVTGDSRRVIVGKDGKFNLK